MARRHARFSLCTHRRPRRYAAVQCGSCGGAECRETIASPGAAIPVQRAGAVGWDAALAASPHLRGDAAAGNAAFTPPSATTALAAAGDAAFTPPSVAGTPVEARVVRGERLALPQGS